MRPEHQEKNGRGRIFLSYVVEDAWAARFVASQVTERGADVRPTPEGADPAGWRETIGSKLRASDFVVILLSPNSVRSDWTSWEINRALRLEELTDRDITVLPALIEDCEIPPIFSSYQLFDARGDRGLGRLRRQINLAPRIEWSRINHQAFENLIKDLLYSLGFRSSMRYPDGSDGGPGMPDMVLSHRHHDPFGVMVEDTWAVETKFYGNAKADLRTVSQVVHYVSHMLSDASGLLVTNGRLTSATRRWLAEEGVKQARLRVIEGTELKRLLLFSEGLIEEYFDGRTRSD